MARRGPATVELVNPWQWLLIVAFFATSIVSYYCVTYMARAYMTSGPGRHRALKAARAYRWLGVWEIMIGVVIMSVHPTPTSYTSGLGPIMVGLCFIGGVSFKRRFDRMLSQ